MLGDGTWFCATFSRDATFDGAKFNGRILFTSTFADEAWFGGTTSDDADFGMSWVLRLKDPDLKWKRVWPEGRTVHPDPDDPDRGSLVRAGHEEDLPPGHSREPSPPSPDVELRSRSERRVPPPPG
jgi:hypothetical protein